MNEWRIASASTIGTSHIGSQTPCQDSHLTRILEDDEGSIVLVAVASDGAGSASLSHVGSRIACEAVFDVVETAAAERRLEASALGPDFQKELLYAVRENIAECASDGRDALRDYACTLLVAIVSEKWSAFLQVGDGAIVFRRRGGPWQTALWPDKGEYANTTTFVTDPNALTRAGWLVVDEPVIEVAVFTDGIEHLVLHYADRRVHAPFFDRIMAPVRADTGAGARFELCDALDRYLSSKTITDRTDDDKTLILATRTDTAA